MTKERKAKETIYDNFAKVVVPACIWFLVIPRELNTMAGRGTGSLLM